MNPPLKQNWESSMWEQKRIERRQLSGTVCTEWVRGILFICTETQERVKKHEIIIAAFKLGVSSGGGRGLWVGDTLPPLTGFLGVHVMSCFSTKVQIPIKIPPTLPFLLFNFLFPREKFKF